MEPLEYNGTPKPGHYYTGMPNADYHRAHGVSKSGLDLIDRSPGHFRYSAPRKSTRAMEIGTAIHTAILEPERFAREYMLLKEVTDRRSSEYKQAVKVYGSEYVLTASEADKVAGMQESVYANPHARKLLESDGWSEMSGFAEDPETGILCRHRADRLTADGVMLDVKKTQDARSWPFSKSIDNYRYHVQAAFYADQYEWIIGDRLDAFMFLAIEEEMPHGVKLYRLDEETLRQGRLEYRENLNTYAQCKERGEWPTYELDGPELIGLPSWRMAQIESEEAEGIY